MGVFHPDISDRDALAVHWLEAFAPGPSSATVARSKAVAVLREAGIQGDSLDAAEVVVGELVANAVSHARTRFTVALTVEDRVVRVEVFDHDGRAPALIRVAAMSARGRGLHLVSALTSQWGWQTTENRGGISGKVVWAELGADPRGVP